MSSGDPSSTGSQGASLRLPDSAPNRGTITPRPRPTAQQKAPTRDPGVGSVIDCAVYVDGVRQEPVAPEDALRVAIERGGFVWLGLFTPSEAELTEIAGRYGLHPLAVEDAVYAHQRPKLDRYDDALFMVLKTATYVEHEKLTATSEVVGTGEVMVFLGPHYVITVRHGEHSGLTELRHRLEDEHDLLARGPASVLYAIADHVVDLFVEVAGAVEVDVDELEASVFSPDRTDDIGRLYQLKRELMQLRRAVSPLEVPLQKLADRQIDAIPEEMRSYFGDVLPRRAALVDPAGVAGPHVVGRQRGHPQDLRLRRHHRRPDGDRRHLRDELPPHARAELAVRLPARAAADRRAVHRAVPRLQAQRLALAPDLGAVVHGSTSFDSSSVDARTVTRSEPPRSGR
jgi:magnesium transporter